MDSRNEEADYGLDGSGGVNLLNEYIDTVLCDAFKRLRISERREDRVNVKNVFYNM
jgi:hypothetical protein